MTANEERVRRHDVGGTHNLRDVGGYRAATGTTRWGRLYRSEALHRIDEPGREQFAALGIRQIIDLRDDYEVELAPSRIDGLEITVHRIPVFARKVAVPETGTLADAYEKMIDEHAATLVRAVQVIADAEGDTVLVHCMAGKDRTGLVIALTLLAAGVDRADVVDDYAATEVNLRGEWMDRARADLVASGREVSAHFNDLFGSPAALLDRTIDRIEERHGSVLEYLRASGLDDDSIGRLRAALIEPADTGSTPAAPSAPATEGPHVPNR
jgi:protein-tyrosine phosphatase